MGIIFLQWVMVASMSIMHPFFVSTTEINFSSEQKELEVIIRIFSDDFENALKKNTEGKVDLLNPEDEKKMNDLIKDYIKERLKITVDDKVLELSYIGYEKQNESIWSYFSVKNVQDVSKINIVNSILYDLTISQINMIHVKVDNVEKSSKLGFPDTAAEFVFSKE